MTHDAAGYKRAVGKDANAHSTKASTRVDIFNVEVAYQTPHTASQYLFIAAHGGEAAFLAVLADW